MTETLLKMRVQTLSRHENLWFQEDGGAAHTVGISITALHRFISTANDFSSW
jgi:hypothetical protein